MFHPPAFLSLSVYLPTNNSAQAQTSNMTFLAIDQRSNLEDGLYTGEEMCTMLCENDGICGLGHVGVEMELNPEALSADVTVEEKKEEDSQQAEPYPSRRPDCNQLAMVDRRHFAFTSTAGDEPSRSSFIKKRNRNASQTKRHTLLKHILRDKATPLKKILLEKATKIIAVSDTSLPLASNAQKTSQRVSSKHHQSSNDGVPGDNSTCCEMTHASLITSSTSTIVSNPSINDSSMAPSSITTSTCDFAPYPNLHAVFESYLVTNPRDAAKKGDFATLSYIANHDDDHIWTQKDVFGNVPLYYACVSYSQAHGQSFGKYGLEAVKLLVRVWPAQIDFPRPLLELLCSEENSIHKDVVEVLSRSRKGDTLMLPLQKENFRVEGMKDVVPISFLEDLGDEGYDEDY